MKTTEDIFVKQVRLPKKRKTVQETYERDPKPRDTDKRKPKNQRELQSLYGEDGE